MTPRPFFPHVKANETLRRLKNLMQELSACSIRGFQTVPFLSAVFSGARGRGGRRDDSLTNTHSPGALKYHHPFSNLFERTIFLED